MTPPVHDRGVLCGIALNLGVAVAIVAAGWAADFLNTPGGFAQALWPPAGLALAFLLGFGYRAVPGVFLGAVLIETWLKLSGIFFPGSVLRAAVMAGSIAAGLTLQACLGAYLVRRRLGWFPQLLDARSIWQFFKLGGLFSSLVGASVGVGALVLGGAMDAPDAPWVWMTWWLGNTFGVLIFAPLVLAVIGKPRSVWRPRRSSVLAPVLLALLPVLALHTLAGMEEKEDQTHEFERRASFANTAIEKSIAKQIEMLYALKAFYYSTSTLNEETFQRYSRELLAFKKGTRGVSWNPVVSREQRREFEHAIGAETGDSEFSIFDIDDAGTRTPAGDRDKYVVITYVEPENDNRSVVGFDVYSRSDRHMAMDRAELRGGLVSTPPIRLLQQPDSYGALVLLPVYTLPEAYLPAATGKPELAGFMTLIVDIPRLLDAALAGLPLDGIEVAIRAQVDDDPAVEVYSATFDNPARPRVLSSERLPSEIIRPLSIADQQWEVSYSPSSAFRYKHELSYTILAIGLLFVSVSGAFFLNLSGHGLATEILVRERTGELLQANKEIRQSEQRFRALVEQSITGIYVFQEDRFVYVNQRFCDIFGYTEQEILDKLKPTDVIDKADRERADDMVSKRLSGAIDSAHYIARGLRGDGRNIWVEIHGSRMEIDGNPAITGTVLDITERRLAEDALEEMNRQLEWRVEERTSLIQRANKELDAFTYSVSHDLRAPLRGIDGWSLALIEDYAEQLDDTAREYLATIRSETQRMGRLIDDMLTLSRATRPDVSLERLDISSLATSVAGRLLKENKGRSIEFSIQPDLEAHGDGRLVEILLTNLFDNACKFTGSRQTARIEFGQSVIPDPDTGQDKQVFFVADNGVGFDMAYVGKLFGTFQRLHSATEFPGTGIGLATVQRIVHRHHGKIWADAKVDGGAKFFFTLGGDDEWEHHHAGGRQS